MEVITFFDKKKEYRCLSNFWEGKICIKDGDEERWYESGELCFHGEKYIRVGKEVKKEERKKELMEYGKRFMVGGDILSSKEAKLKGGKGKNGFRLEKEELYVWDKEREKVQYEICKWKMDNYEEVRKMLMESKNNLLVHPALRCSNEKMKDKIWEGRVVVEDGSVNILGGNKLGNMWMEMRKML